MAKILSNPTTVVVNPPVSPDDWSTRSRAPGVVFANRLQLQSDLTAWRLADTTADHVTLDTSLKVPGAAASFKFSVRNADGAQSGNVGVPLSRQFGEGTTLWWSFRVRAPATHVFQPWPAGGNETGTKLCTLGTSRGSHMSNTVVNQINYNYALISGYYYDNSGGGGPVPDQAFTPSWATSGDFKMQPAIDNGPNPLTGTNPDTGAAWSAQEQGTRQFGGLYTGKISPRSRAGFGDPLAGGVKQQPDEWMTITNRLVIGTWGGANSRWTMWAARDNAPYVRLHDLQNIRLGIDVPYDTLWLLPYTTTRQPGGRKVGSRTGNIPGAEILVVGLDTPLGVGTLEYNSTTQRFRWLGNGESFGVARGFSASNNLLTINVASGGQYASYVVVRITPAALPKSGTVTDSVTIVDGRPDTQVNYNDVIVSTQAINASGGYVPDDGSPPAWTPPKGKITTVGLNTVATDATVNPQLDPRVNPPALFPNNSPWHEVSGIGVAAVYSGAVFAPLLGSSGSMLMTMSGHSAYNDNGVYRYDAATQLHSRLSDPYGGLTKPFRNGVAKFADLRDAVVGGGWYSSGATCEYYADTSKTTTLADQPAGFQSYDHNVYIPPGFAGMGAKGGLFTPARVARSPSGQFGSRAAHIMDLAGSPPVWQRFGSYSNNAGQGSACLSMARRKVYMVSGASGSSNILWTANLDTRAITEPTFTAGAYIFSQAGDNLRYSEARDCLFVAGFGAGSTFCIQVIDPSGPTVFTPSITGTLPTTRGGGEWVEADQAFYYYAGGFTLYKVTLPAGNPQSGTWNCTSITLAGTMPTPATGGVQHISRLRWCPAAQCFLWWADNSSPVQAFSLA